MYRVVRRLQRLQWMVMTDRDVEEVRQAEKLLADLRRALLRLHKVLDWEQAV
jgi:hypothetical protein